MISIFNALRPAFQQLQYEEKVKRYEASLYPVILMIKGNFKRIILKKKGYYIETGLIGCYGFL